MKAKRKEGPFIPQFSFNISVSDMKGKIIFPVGMMFRPRTIFYKNFHDYYMKGSKSLL